MNSNKNEYINLVENLRQKLKLDHERIAILPKHRSVGDTWYFLLSIQNLQCVLKKQMVILMFHRSIEMSRYVPDFQYETYTMNQEEIDILYGAEEETARQYDNILINLKYNYDYNSYVFNNSRKVFNNRISIPEFPEFNKDLYIQKHNVIPGRTVLIIPISNYITPLPVDFWNISADFFRFLGYHVIFNVPEEDSKIYHGENVFAPFSEIVGLADLCGTVFAMRTGIMDVLSASKAEMYVFSTKNMLPIFWVYHISNADRHIKTIYMKKAISFRESFTIEFVKEKYIKQYGFNYKNPITAFWKICKKLVNHAMPDDSKHGDVRNADSGYQEINDVEICFEEEMDEAIRDEVVQDEDINDKMISNDEMNLNQAKEKNLFYKDFVLDLSERLDLNEEHRIAVYSRYWGIGDIWYLLRSVHNLQKALGKQIVVLLKKSRFSLASFIKDSGFETYELTNTAASLMRSVDADTAIQETAVLNLRFHDEYFRYVSPAYAYEHELSEVQFPPYHAEELAEKYKIIPGKTVYIIPDSNYIRPLPDYFWNLSACFFRSLGYDVIFNGSAKATRNYDGKSAFPPFSESVALADICGTIFGMRTGYMDLLAASTAKMYVFSTKRYLPIDQIYHIENPDERIKTIYFEERDYFFDNFPFQKIISPVYNDGMKSMKKQLAVQCRYPIQELGSFASKKRKSVSALRMKYNSTPNRFQGGKVLDNRYEYMFENINGILYFVVYGVHFQTNRMDLTLYEKDVLVDKLMDYPFCEAVFKPEKNGDYTIEAEITQHNMYYQYKFSTDMVHYEVSYQNPYDLVYCWDFEEYMKLLGQFQKELLILMVSSDSHTCKTPDGKTEKLKMLNQYFQIKTELQSTYRHSFAAVLERGNILYENVDSKLEIKHTLPLYGQEISVLSRGFYARVRKKCPVEASINGINYAVNKRGLNIVVWSIAKNQCIDSIYFDILIDDLVKRIPDSYMETN